ncbi:hypothetical protein DEJ28_14165 [Curtobacterium sp. MCPF17_002]|uniref:hypothetical protein n=1 Tax=Curtobacterium sp. MCPF17_002 TaxID=2175645 RepID=UPI000DA6E00B|nr:hypothetical protein [Curtobacterium sp. MCPF17_002]WIB76787.1 hypothetical protein DEJ28_14165 [Curtobacterium sp. MCPF17_002]
MKIAIAILLFASLISSGLGTWWSTRPIQVVTFPGLSPQSVPGNKWKANRGALGLGIGLILTTVAGVLALTL